MAKAPVEKRNPPNNPPIDVDSDPIAEEIAKRLSAILPQGQRAQAIAQITSLVMEERYSGPLPHPRHFGEFERHLPGSGDRLLSMVEQNITHSQAMQDKALDADIADMKEGRRLGFAALVILMVGAIICGALGKDAIAFALLGATVIGTIGQLIKGRGKSRD